MKRDNLNAEKKSNISEDNSDVSAKSRATSSSSNPATNIRHEESGSHVFIPDYKAILAIAMIMVGCCANFFSLELIIKLDKGCGSLITVTQFLLISAEGLIFHINFRPPFGLKKRIIPIYCYLVLVVMFFSQAVINNLVFDYGISLPLHSIFRSGSLVISMLMGILFFHERYSLPSILSVISVTFGIILATYTSSQTDTKAAENDNQSIRDDPGISNPKWLFGIALLIVSQVMSALLGYTQQYFYRRYGKDWRENMFYSHLLSIPFFLLMMDDLSVHITTFNQSEPLAIGSLVVIPRLWIYLALNVFTQYVCINGVYRLSARVKPLTLTLVITVRKFVSLLISIVYFKNYFTTRHWIATCLVFGGGVAFTIFSSMEKKKNQEDQKEKVK